MSESRIVPKKNAVKGQARAKAKRVYGTIEGFKIPRKITAEAAAPRKETALDVSANTAVIINQQFGAHGAHQNRGKLRPKSPFGANMSLSRRLSRRIIQGSPLRSPMWVRLSVRRVNHYCVASKAVAIFSRLTISTASKLDFTSITQAKHTVNDDFQANNMWRKLPTKKSSAPERQEQSHSTTR
jgi:hypothetical protein